MKFGLFFMPRMLFYVVIVLMIFQGSACEHGAGDSSVSGGDQQGPALEYAKSLDEFVQNGAQVNFMLQQDANSQSYLTARFTPMEAGYYFYGNELPVGGIQGLGVPTRLDILSNEGVIINDGEVISDKSSINLKIEYMDVELPVYEPGPVSLSIPVHIETEDAAVEVGISYMLCRKSDGTCLPPVRNKAVKLSL